MENKKEELVHTKMSLTKNPLDFKIKDVESVPNRFICFIKVKIFDGEKLFIKCYGSGVLVSEGLVLTAAHNIKCRREAI